MFQVRNDEPSYAFVPDVETPEQNQWGKEIKTVKDDSPLLGKSLSINGDAGISANPNRYKQHGFHFSADNCIGCHACEAACSEKNDLPAHLSFRSVGYVEGGSYPAYRRLNISMACNHCDDPVCLKGCPTRAYTKYAEYGAVLQDPDICFGCGYCTWVCPYNAPQLDPVQGQVSKCNMCVDRLEVGLKPACAAACLGGALDFGLIETTPENRDQTKLQIPGFPDPEITHPNIRFEQVKSLPKEMTRPDTAPIRYQRNEQGDDQYKVKAALVDKPRQWSLPKLRSREDPLVFFTLATQAVIGAFMVLFLGPLFGAETLSIDAHPIATRAILFGLLFLQTVALGMSTMHLGKPHRFYRAFNNLRYSPVSREVAAVTVFYILLVSYTLVKSGLFAWMPQGFIDGIAIVIGLFACIVGPITVYAMHKIYRIKARPYWNHWQILTSFYGNTLVLGSLSVGMVYALTLTLQGESIVPLMSGLGVLIVIGLLSESIGLKAHADHLNAQGGEATAAHIEQRSTFGNTYLARNISLGVSTAIILLLVIQGIDGYTGLLAWSLLTALIVVTAFVGRALFYVLVIPTTMPGAFFWKNQGFQEHAREAGLADMPQVGVLPRTAYHEVHIARAKREIKEDLEKLKALGASAALSAFKAALKERWKQNFGRATS